MIKLTTNKKDITIIAVDKKVMSKQTIKKNGTLTEYASKLKAELYFDKVTTETLTCALGKIMQAKRNYQIDVKSFIKLGFKEQDLLWIVYEKDLEVNKNIYNVKTKTITKGTINLIGVSASGKKIITKIETMTRAREITMDLQMTPPNVQNAVQYAETVKKLFAKNKNLTIKILTKKEIVAQKMGLLLSVNAGSGYEPRVVIIEYKGDAKSKAKTAFVGKGIVFDAGGYNIKTGGYMRNMKFDMSGSAAVVGAMKAVAELKPKANVAGVLVITDNMVNSVASTPDSVWTASNGKTVEVNNTDAEGRLAMADGMVYAANKLKASRIITIATLTGAILAALGHTYTGVWSTTEKGWKDVEKAATIANENMWRMPLHKDFFKYMASSKVADMFNTDLSGVGGGSSSAAMFLSQFAEGKEFIHFDIAGTADVNGDPKGVAVKTLFEVING